MYSLSVITSIFSEMEWDCSTKEDMLDSSLGLTENIIMSYLGLTEDKTTELLCIQAFLKSKVITKQAAMSCFFSQQINYSKNASFLLSQDTDRNNPKDLAKFLLSQNSDQLQQQISFQPAVNTWGSYVKSVIFCGWRCSLIWALCLTGLLSADYEADEAPLTDEEEWPISQEELRKKISKQVGEIRIEWSVLIVECGFLPPCYCFYLLSPSFVFFRLPVIPFLISGFIPPSCVTSLISLF